MSGPDRTLATARDLVDAGLAHPEQAAELDAVGRRYAIAVSPAMAALIDPADPADPIARQLVPSAAELVTRPQERADPIGDDAHSPVPGLVHRYPDRVLLKLQSACPVYCRFCFRRETVGPGGAHILDDGALTRALDYIAARPAIVEVILTGGDPLMVSARRLAAIVTRIAAIPHVASLRVHSRVPIADPDRISPELIVALTSSRLPVWTAIHVNHARELGPAQRAAIARLADGGIPLLGQTVLLAGVNDDPDALAELMRALIALRVKPYYLHHPDLAPGTAHFRLPLARGREIVAELHRRVPGIARPTYVLDIPGGFGKVAVLSPAVTQRDNGSFDVVAPDGSRHIYHD